MEEVVEQLRSLRAALEASEEQNRVRAEETRQLWNQVQQLESQRWNLEQRLYWNEWTVNQEKEKQRTSPNEYKTKQIEAKTIKQPEPFDNKESSFKDWMFKFRNWFRSTYPDFSKMYEWILEQTTLIIIRNRHLRPKCLQ